MSAATHFSQSYAQARGQFMATAARLQLPVYSQIHPLCGVDGEALALDVVRDGPADARAVLLISSACHGVEGFCGSGIQLALLSHAPWRAACAAAGLAVVYAHALNPYGFSWWRRTTHENVDLNRNFHDFGQPLPRNPGYEALAAQIVPSQWPPSASDAAALADYAHTHGPRGLQAALSGGQHSHPQGIFYGGLEATWSHLAVRKLLRTQASECQRLAWIDLHTGLGPSGHGERIYAGPDDAAAIRRAKAWWGEQVTSIYDGSSSSAPLTGLMWHSAAQECAQAQVTGMALEYGTLPLNEVLDALRADQWLQNQGEAATPAQRLAIKRQVRDAFYTDTDVWKQQLVDQAQDAAWGALRGLTG